MIPGGTFQMGALNYDDEYALPVHTVSVPAFWLGKYEVTYDEWNACVADGGCEQYRTKGKLPLFSKSWDEAWVYIRWLNGKTGGGYRLLTEAEWEYAARAGTTSIYAFGYDHRGLMNCRSQDCGNPWRFAAPVGSFPPNAWGLHDMHGNVTEWVQDCWHDNYEGAPSDGSAWESGDCSHRVLRGRVFFGNGGQGIPGTLYLIRNSYK